MAGKFDRGMGTASPKNKEALKTSRGRTRSQREAVKQKQKKKTEKKGTKTKPRKYKQS